MEHISKHMGKHHIEEMVEKLGRHMEQQRQAGIKDFGWDENCECHECGDTGINPHTTAACWCDTGRRVQLHKELEASWPLYAPHIHVNARLGTHPSEAARKFGEEWLANDYPEKYGMVLSGTVGSGKTGLAVALAYIVHMSGKRVRIGTFTEILDDMRPGAETETKPADMFKPYLLVLDDLGTQKVTEFVDERLFSIIDGRHHRKLPTIITTNLGMKELQDKFGTRVVSRILEVARFTTLTGDDLRMRNLRIS